MTSKKDVLAICGQRGFAGLRDWAKQNKAARADFAQRIKRGEDNLLPLLSSLETEWAEMIAPNLKS